MDSGGAVTLLAVTDTGWHGHVAPQKWVTNIRLLTKKMPPASFIILSPAEKVRRAAVTATFGQPDKIYRYGAFTILVWQQNLVPQMLRADKRAGHASRERHPPRRDLGSLGWGCRGPHRFAPGLAGLTRPFARPGSR